REGPKRSDELAVQSQTHAPSLQRLLHALAEAGVFVEVEDDCFALTPLGQGLCSHDPDSIRDSAIDHGEEWNWLPWGQLLHSVQTGESGFEHIFGMERFQYFAQHPRAAALFEAGLTSRTRLENRVVLASYNFQGARTIVDIGGGEGTLLVAILEAHP